MCAQRVCSLQVYECIARYADISALVFFYLLVTYCLLSIILFLRAERQLRAFKSLVINDKIFLLFNVSLHILLICVKVNRG